MPKRHLRGFQVKKKNVHACARLDGEMAHTYAHLPPNIAHACARLTWSVRTLLTTGLVAHLWAKWLRHPCRLGDPHRCRAGGEIRSGPQVGKVATSPLPSRGSPPLQGGGGNQKWPTSGQSGYVTPAVSGIPTASERGGEIRSGPQVGKVATSPLPSRGSPPLQSGGQNQKWPTSGQGGYVTPAVSGIPTAAQLR